MLLAVVNAVDDSCISLSLTIHLSDSIDEPIWLILNESQLLSQAKSLSELQKVVKKLSCICTGVMSCNSDTMHAHLLCVSAIAGFEWYSTGTT